jgi:toxin FitB
LNVVDTSGWIELLVDGPNADSFERVIADTENLLVPSVCLLEVVKYLTRSLSRTEALQTAGQMRRARVVDLDAELAIVAARLGLKHNLPLADSIIYATAQAAGATLFTQDEDFKGLPGVKYMKKK